MSTFTISIKSLNGNIPSQVETGVAGELILSGELCYYASDGMWYKASSTSASTCSTELRIATTNIVPLDLGTFMLYGEIIVTGPLVVGSKYYVGETAGTITDTPSVNPLHYQRYIGTAKSTGSLIFNPDASYISINGRSIDGIVLPADHTALSNIGINTHAQIDTALTRLVNTSGNNTGDQDLSPYETIESAALKQYLTTGFISGLELTINTDNTKFDIASGEYIITDYTDPLLPVPTSITYNGLSGVTPSYLASSNATYLALNSSGTIIQSSSPFTSSDRRSLCTIGAVIHSNHININLVNEIKAPIVGDTNQLHDLMKIIGSLNIEGNIYSPNGANLLLNKSGGTIFGLGINAHDFNNPHVLVTPSVSALTFRYRLQDGTEYTDRTTINPTQYDLNGVLTTVDNNKFTVQHINLFQSNVTRIQYGQKEYASMADAKAFTATDPFNTEQNIAENSIFRCYLILKKGVTNLTQGIIDETVFFIVVDKFGSVVGGSSVPLTLASLLSTLGYTPEDITNKVTSISIGSTNIQYPSAKLLYDQLALKEPANVNIQSHISSILNPHSVTKTQVGLSNVDNTSDLDKPISNLTQIAINDAADANFVYSQGLPSNIWNITHTLNKSCSTTIVDTSGTVVIGEIQYIDNNNIIITFSSAFAGKAYLN